MTDENTNRLLEKELDRQAEQLVEFREASKGEARELRKEVKDVPALQKEVEMLRDTVKSNTSVMYLLVGVIITSGLAGALLKGVI